MCCKFCISQKDCENDCKGKRAEGLLHECFSGKYFAVEKEYYDRKLTKDKFTGRWMPYFFLAGAKRIDTNLVEVKALVKLKTIAGRKIEEFAVLTVRAHRNVKYAVYTFQVLETSCKMSINEFEEGLRLR